VAAMSRFPANPSGRERPNSPNLVHRLSIPSYRLIYTTWRISSSTPRTPGWPLSTVVSWTPASAADDCGQTRGNERARMGGDEQGHHGGPPGGFIERGMVGNDGTTAVVGSDIWRRWQGFWGVNLGAPPSSGCQWSLPLLWDSPWRPGASLSATRTWRWSTSPCPSHRGGRRRLSSSFYFTKGYGGLVVRGLGRWHGLARGLTAGLLRGLLQSIR
jgi:hypothetical protein